MQIKVTFSSDNLQSVIKDLDTVVDAAPRLGYNIANVYGNRIVKTARGYLGTSGPASNPWAQLAPTTIDTKGHGKILVGGYRRGGYLGKVGDLGRGIKITKSGRGQNPFVEVESTDWKSAIHEYGQNPSTHKPFNGPVKFPGRPFFSPAIMEVENDSQFNTMLINFILDNLEALSFGKSSRDSIRWFDEYSSGKGGKGGSGKSGPSKRSSRGNGGGKKSGRKKGRR